MSYSIQVQRTIKAPIANVWGALTEAEMVKKYLFGTQLITTWKVGTPILFQGEWEGQKYVDKGMVLHYEKEKKLTYSYLSSWDGLEDKPENYQNVTYSVKSQGQQTILLIRQTKLPSAEKKQHSAKNWAMLLKTMQKLLEV